MNRKAAVLSIVLLALPAPAAQAAEMTRFQAVPQAGLRTGGSFRDAVTDAGRDLDTAASVGIALEWRVRDEDRWWQLWYSRQATQVKTPDGRVDLRVEYLHAGGTAPIDDEGKVASYVVGGVGATRFSPAGAGPDDASRFSASLGVGLSMPLSARTAMRVEARGYLTWLNSATSIFCSSGSTGGACSFASSGSTLFQAELTVGIAFGF